VYVAGRKGRGQQFLHTKTDKVVVAIILAALVVSIIMLVTGQVTW
jgi:hypothetical protein